jgi:hypothetical protein
MTINIASRATILQNTAYGKILQVVRATDATTRTTTSTSLVDVTGMTVTITPQRNDSAILLITTGYVSTQASTDNTTAIVAITDASNNTISGAQSTIMGTQDLTGQATRIAHSPIIIIGYSTPATSSATTYKTRFRSGVGTTTTRYENATQTGQMYAIEISA